MKTSSKLQKMGPAITSVSERQLEIIEAAGRILSQSGVSGLTIKNLAAEMEFSEAAVYRHFKSKEDILVAMLEYLAQGMDERLSKAVVAANTPRNKFIALFREQFRFFKKNPHFVVAVFSDGLLEESARINQAIFNIMSVKMKILMPVVMEGQHSGVFTNDITTEELVHVIMGTFRLQMYKWRIAHFKFDIERQGENMIEAVLTLIKRHK